MMKIYGNASKIYPNPGATRISRKPQTEHPPENQNVKKKVPNKINIPENFKEKLSLNKNEQEFFTKLYPHARKEIQQYQQNQNHQPVEKGKHIDVRG